MSTSTTDRARIWATAYDLRFWLEWYGAPADQTREMQQELESNLRDAAAEPGGAAGAVRRLGSLRQYARDAAGEVPRFLWRRGLMVAVTVFAVVVLVQLVLTLTYADGLIAAGGGSGRLWLLGARVEAVETGDTLAVSFVWGAGVPLLLAAVAFVLASRPWRLLRRSGRPAA